MQKSEDRWPVEIDSAHAAFVQQRQKDLAGEFPRFALLLFQWRHPASLDATLRRIPEFMLEWFTEVIIVISPSVELPADTTAAIREWKQENGVRLQFHRQPGNRDFGGSRKGAFEYAIQRSFDFVVTMRGDGRHPPEVLPSIIRAALEDPERLVVASRVHRLMDRPPGIPLVRMSAHRIATAMQNRLLGLRLEDYHSSYRLYPVKALRCIPFQLNSRNSVFDMQMVIQCRALGLAIREVPVPPSWAEYSSDARGLREVLAACANAFGYRLHQLHVTRDGRYFVERGVHYTLKKSPTGSHHQIVDAIAPGSHVLDLGCSQGLLARPLAEKRARVVGVDAREQDWLASELASYHQRDLEESLELPMGREFDFVVISDVIEHLRNREQLLRGARRFLKEGGRLIVSTPNVALWFYRLSLLVGRFEYGARGVLDKTHVHLYTRSTFRREIERAGFRIIRERVTALPFEVVFESTGRSRLVRWSASIYHALARIWPGLFAYQVILEAESTTLDEESVAERF